MQLDEVRLGDDRQEVIRGWVLMLVFVRCERDDLILKLIQVIVWHCSAQAR